MITDKQRQNIQDAVDAMHSFHETVDFDYLIVRANKDIYGVDDYDLPHWDAVVECISTLEGIPLEWSVSECTNGCYYGQWQISKATPLAKVKQLAHVMYIIPGIVEVELQRLGTYGHTEEFVKGEV